MAKSKHNSDKQKSPKVFKSIAEMETFGDKVNVPKLAHNHKFQINLFTEQNNSSH